MGYRIPNRMVFSIIDHVENLIDSQSFRSPLIVFSLNRNDLGTSRATKLVLWKNSNTRKSLHSSPSGVPVVSAVRAFFVHRSNADGTIDSFCRECLITVASSQWEVELDRAEKKHLCDPVRLEYVGGVLRPPQA